MTLLLIVLLVLLWGAVIVPALLRVRQSPATSVGTFRRNMQMLGSRVSARQVRRMNGASGRWVLGPPPPRPGRRRVAVAGRAVSGRAVSGRAGYGRPTAGRSGEIYPGGLTLEQRRTIFFTLLIAALLTLMLGTAYGLVLRIHVGVDVALAGFVIYLARTRPRATAREAVSYRVRARRLETAARAMAEGSGEREWLRAGEM